MNLDLETLEAQWLANEAVLERTLRLHLTAARASRLARVETGLRRLRLQVVGELLVNVAALALAGSFLGAHLDSPPLLGCAAALQLAALALVVASARQLRGLARLRLEGPIARTQAELERLRSERLRTGRWTLLASPLLWVPLAVVGGRALLGLDLLTPPWTGWLAASAGLGLAVVAGGAVLGPRLEARLRSWPLLRRLARDLAGLTLAEAMAAAGEVARFEGEEGQGTGPVEPGGER
jgi:hypothetical protein